jgi:Ca2+:H+ antiporter
MVVRHLGRTAHNLSSSSLRKKFNVTLVHKVPCATLHRILVHLQEVLLGTKLALLFPAVVLALLARVFQFGHVQFPSFLSFS